MNGTETADAVAKTARTFRAIHARLWDDERFRVKAWGPRRGAGVTIWCAYCGTRLVDAETRTDEAILLAYRNASRRPCCDLWRVP